MRCVQIGLVEVLLPNYLVVRCKYVVSIVLAIDWFVPIVHLFVGDKL